MNDDSLWPACKTSVAIRHGQCYHLTGASDELEEGVWSLLLALYHGFHDTGVVRAQVDETVGHPCL